MWRFVAFGEPRRRYRSDYLLPYHDALDLLKTCVGCSDKAKAQLILKVEIEPPLDVSIVLRDFVRDMHRPQIVEATVEATVKVTVEAIVTALELKAGFGEIHPDDMWRVFSAENSNVAQLFLRRELDPDLKLEKRNSRTKGHIQQPAALLCAACMRSDTIVLEALIEKGADMRVFKEQASPCFLQNDPLRPELFEPHIRTPVSVAALLTPNLSCLKFLLDRKYVQPDVEGVNKWLLHYLCVPSELFPKRLSCFIGEIGIGARFNNNSTPFNLSAVEPPPETRVPDNRRACLEMLLKHGLDPNSICMSVSGSALPMLSFAAETGNLEVMELLLEYGALIDFGQFGQGTALMHVLDCAQQNEDPIKCQRQLNTAMDLVEDGADVAPGGETAVTAIHMVIWFKSSAMLNLLFAYMQAGTRPLKYEHMDTPQYIKCMINRGYMGTATALIQAVECAAPDLVKTLLANGADVHQIDRLGRTALMMAARQLLRYAGPRPETKESHDVEMICAELLLHGADPCGSDEAGHNAFFYAGDERSRFAELVEKETLRRRKDAEDRRKAAEDRRKAVRDDSTAAADSAAEDTSAEDDSTSAEDDSTATADDSIAIEDDNIAAEDIAAEDSTAIDGESNAQVTAVVEGDTQVGVERAPTCRLKHCREAQTELSNRNTLNATESINFRLHALFDSSLQQYYS
ncbi:hypothetical protein BB8028_0001g04950 [Beauveria bassiana]|uniref:Uncharacterized protein n=1 Tax=Beauveria bassiana TaxID=176275 RepID=A0A2S7XWX3_BEABA|nr:hypothetical protein BB8028_0001g04950 [Beauveria bassiana]